ncbi:MAG: carboxypeptidase-like regulatory domain-containing protein [Acidobacteriia bacterium]|nr:carboxypeptidase-like regulatory domain-containing protein [Terriglobia bacterium]
MRLRNYPAFLLLSALTVFGQGTQGTISGSVTDQDGAAVANAQVEVKNEAGAQFQAKTSASGGYTLSQLPVGTYRIAIASPGLQPFSKDKIAVQPGQTVRLDARLADFPSLGSVGEDRTFYAEIFESHKTPTGPAPRTPGGQPDFSGVWHPLRDVDPGKPQPLPWAEELSKQRLANNLKDLPSSFCLPSGILAAPALLPFRIMQNSTLLAILYEGELPRQIYLDGRKHPEESLSPFVGHSVGKWDGDTLVVDTVGFNDKTWLDALGHPHTDKMHVIERFRRKDLGHLEVEFTIDDPGAYKTPWIIKKATELADPSDEVGQYVCTENNRDVPHLVGK